MVQRLQFPPIHQPVIEQPLAGAQNGYLGPYVPVSRPDGRVREMNRVHTRSVNGPLWLIGVAALIFALAAGYTVLYGIPQRIADAPPFTTPTVHKKQEPELNPLAAAEAAEKARRWWKEHNLFERLS